MKLENVKIGKRLVFGYSMFILIIVVGIVSGIKQMTEMNNSAGATGVAFQRVMLANAIVTNLQTISWGTLFAAYTEDLSPLAKVEESRKSYQSALEEFERLSSGNSSDETLEEFKTSIKKAREANEELSKVVEARAWSDAKNLLIQHAAPLTNKALSAGGLLIESEGKEMRAKNLRIRQNNNRTKAWLIGLGLISLASCLFISFTITRSITRSIRKNIDIAKTLADGNMCIDITADRKDEFGEEARAFRTMVEKWKVLIGHVKNSAVSVAAASHHLHGSAEQLSHVAAAQVERTLQVSTASEEMSQASLDIAKNANGISNSARDMVDIAEKGNGIVRRSVDEVKAIALTVSKSSDLVRNLGDESGKIGQIVEVINEIADQTNLLALNAAIEAARAGDAGRGFAVVAGEVKKLAERTSQATQEIGAMINAIKSGVEKAVKSMMEASQKVKTGVELSEGAGNALSDIVTSSANLQLMVQQIASAIEEMNVTTGTIAEDTQRVASATKDSSRAADQITHAAAELDGLSVNLEDSVKGFRLQE